MNQKLYSKTSQRRKQLREKYKKHFRRKINRAKVDSNC